MAKILDQYGNPIERGQLSEPQTAKIAALKNQYLDGFMGNLSPDRLSRALRAADDGDLYMQHRIFADMEERDPHLFAEMNKRKLALLGVTWRVEPPPNATAKEKAGAEWLADVLTNGEDPFEDVLLAMMDGVGHGFSAIETVWNQRDGYLLPTYSPRPQEWFQLDRDRRELRLRDSTADGAQLNSFGWVLHAHGKAKTGYIGRMGIYRVCIWPFVYKAYGIADFAEFLETFGLPIITGKYFQGATEEEKSTLLRAVTTLGHSARAIMPLEMQLEVAKVTSSGDGSPHLSMVDWADRAHSKAILGQTLSAEAKATGMGSGVADLQAEVREDILRADAREISGTVMRDILYPMLALNRGCESLSRCARLVFEFDEPADIKTYSDALPKLVNVGLKTIPVAWVHKKLGIPEPDGNEPTLGAAPDPTPGPDQKVVPNTAQTQTAALSAIDPPPAPWAALAADVLADTTQPSIDAWLAQIRGMLDKAESLEEFEQMLLAAYPSLDAANLTATVGQAFLAANLRGRADVNSGTA